MHLKKLNAAIIAAALAVPLFSFTAYADNETTGETVSETAENNSESSGENSTETETEAEGSTGSDNGSSTNTIYAYVNEDTSEQSGQGETQAENAPDIIVSVDDHQELMDRYGLSQVGHSSGSGNITGTDEELAALYAQGVTGWVKLAGGGYKYIEADGNIAKDKLIVEDGYTYRMNADGLMVTGWWTADENSGVWYYYYEAANAAGLPEGAMAVNTDIDGYQINSQGIYANADAIEVNILNQVGWSLEAAYNYSARLTYHRFTADPNLGINWFANYGFTNGYGNCYVMASTFCKLARQLGYDAYVMAGYVPRRGGGITPHSWCELIIDGQTRVFDPNFTNETGNNGYNIYYGKSGTWRYQSYSRMHD